MRVRRSLLFVFGTVSLVASAAHGQPKTTKLQTAQELLKEGKVDEALALVDPIIAQALTKDAKDPKAICPSAAVAALQYLMKGVTVTVEDDWCDAMLLKAYALNELKRPAEAGQVLASLVQHNPDNPQYLIEYAYTVRVNGGLESALDLYKRAGRLASRIEGESGKHWQAVALRGEGFVYSDLQRWDDATKAYQRSMKFEPDSDIARNEMQYIEQHRPH